ITLNVTNEVPICEYPVLINNSASSDNQEGYVLAYRHDSLENLPIRYTDRGTEQTGLSNPKKIRMASADRGTDCKMSPFKATGECSKPCGGGTQKYTRNIIKQPTENGKACESLEVFEECNSQPCPPPGSAPAPAPRAAPVVPANTPGAGSTQEPVDYLEDCKKNESISKVLNDYQANSNTYGISSSQIYRNSEETITLDTSNRDSPVCVYPVYINQPITDNNKNVIRNIWKPYYLKYTHNSLNSLPYLYYWNDSNNKYVATMNNPRVEVRGGIALQ
ncbi:MAG: thrombospondin type-1 domain-containing protein, partial [Candidatus Paceibacterota bacterium]